MESKIKFNPDLEAEGGKLYRQYCEEKGIEYSITAGANFCLGYMAVKSNDPITAAADRISDKLIAIVKKQLGEANDESAGESDAVEFAEWLLTEAIGVDESISANRPVWVYKDRKYYTSHQLYSLFKKEPELRLGNDHWIDVNDQLPEESGRYWCYMKELTDLGWSYFQWNCAYNANEKRFSDSTLFNGEQVIYWRNLPEPPKFKQQKENP